MLSSSDSAAAAPAGTAELMAALGTLQSCGPTGVITVMAAPLYDAVMTLFRFVREQAGRQADDMAILKKDYKDLRDVVNQNVAQLSELEALAGRHAKRATVTPEELDRARGDLERQHSELQQGLHQRLERQASELSRRLDDLQHALKKMQDDAVTSGGPSLRETAAMQAELGRLEDTVKSTTAHQRSQLEALQQRQSEQQGMIQQLAMSLQRCEDDVSSNAKQLIGTLQHDQQANSNALATLRAEVDHQLQAHGKMVDDMRKEQQQQRLLAPPPAPAPPPTPPPPPTADPMIREALGAMKERLEDLEETRDEQTKATLVITQYFDKLDHLYALLELDKRAASWGAAASSNERIQILHSLPAFKQIIAHITSESRSAGNDEAAAQQLQQAIEQLQHQLQSLSHQHQTLDQRQSKQSQALEHQLQQLLQQLQQQQQHHRESWGNQGQYLPRSPQGKPQTEHRNISPSRLPSRPASAVPEWIQVGGMSTPTRFTRDVDLRDSDGGSMPVPAAGVEVSDGAGLGGATVVGVTVGGPAHEAGWRAGDHLVGVSGTPVNGARDFAAAIARSPQAQPLPVTRIPHGHYRPVTGPVILGTSLSGSAYRPVTPS